jgi:hypothetical protein
MVSFTLDTNCLIAVDEGRAERAAVMEIIAAAKAGMADVAMVASCASERQVGGRYLATIQELRDRMATLGFGDVGLLKPIATYGLSFYDHAVYASKEQLTRQELIFRTLFPSTEPDWPTFAKAKDLPPDDLTTRPAWHWRNKYCDVQAIWAHDHYGRDFFVTTDSDFDPLRSAAGFSALRVVTPAVAASHLPRPGLTSSHQSPTPSS